MDGGVLQLLLLLLLLLLWHPLHVFSTRAPPFATAEACASHNVCNPRDVATLRGGVCCCGRYYRIHINTTMCSPPPPVGNGVRSGEFVGQVVVAAATRVRGRESRRTHDNSRVTLQWDKTAARVGVVEPWSAELHCQLPFPRGWVTMPWGAEPHCRFPSPLFPR